MSPHSGPRWKEIVGTVDSLNWRLTCPQCKAAEAVWPARRGVKPGIDGPDLDSATCNKCNVPARVE